MWYSLWYYVYHIYHDYVAQYDTAFVNLDLSKWYFDQLLTYLASNE